MQIYQNIFGKRYESDEPCFMTIASGEKVWSRLVNDWYDWDALAAKAAAESHTWQLREVGIPSIKWQLANTFMAGVDFAPGLDDTEALASEAVVNGEDWTGATGATPPTSWTDAGTDLAFSLGGASDILIMESPMLGGAITQELTLTPDVVYVVELSVYDGTTGDARVSLDGVMLPIGPVNDPSGSAAALKCFSFMAPAGGAATLGFHIAGGGKLVLRYARCFLESELTGAGVVDGGGAGGGGPVEPPNPVKGPYMAFGTEFWINTDNCYVGFDVDSDPDPDIWMSGQEVCESDIEDRIKMAINAQLIADGCPGLPCMTAAGNLQKAYTQAVMNPPEPEPASEPEVKSEGDD